MKYVALLRGINVGGNNMVKMSELKVLFEAQDYKNVKTYINSGNVIFESDEDAPTLTKKLEKAITKSFNYNARVILKSIKEMKQIVKDVPHDWNTRDDIRCYVGFMARPLSTDEIKSIAVKEGVDTLKVGKEVLYMTSLLSKLTKSAFNKIAGTKIYQDMTIRNYNTTKKILALMEQK